jgi:hypothetical protein
MDEEEDAARAHMARNAEAIAETAILLTDLITGDRLGMGHVIIPFRGDGHALVIVATDERICDTLMQALEYIDRYEMDSEACNKASFHGKKKKCPSDVM